MEEQLRMIYGDYLIEDGEVLPEPMGSYQKDDLVVYRDDDTRLEESTRWKLGKYFLSFSLSLLKAGARDIAPEWNVVEVPKMIYVPRTNVIVNETKFNADESDVNYGWRWTEKKNLESKCRRSSDPLPDSVYYGVKWYLKWEFQCPLLKTTKLHRVPDTEAPERMKIGYFPSGCESNEDRMKYLMERYQESRKECDAFNWRHRKNTCAPWFKETQPRPEDLLRFHNQGRHLQGFFRFERHARTGEVFLVDIYYRHKFPSSDSLWTTKQTEHFDELNMFYENFSHFLRINHKSIREATDDPKYFITSCFAICNHPDESEDCQGDVPDAGFDVSDSRENRDELDDFVMEDEPRDQPSTSNSVGTKRRREECNPLDHLINLGFPQKKRAAPQKQKNDTAQQTRPPRDMKAPDPVMSSDADDRWMREDHVFEDDDVIVIENPANEPKTSNGVMGNREKDLARMFNTRMEVSEEAPASIETDAIPLLILKALDFDTINPESSSIGSLLDMDTDLRNFVGPHRENFRLFRNMVRMECRLRRLMSQEGNRRKSRKRMEELSEVVEPYRQIENFSKESVKKELQEGNRFHEYTTDAWNFKEAFLAAAHCFIENNQSIAPIIMRFDKLAARWNELLDKSQGFEDAPKITIRNGDGSEADLLLEAVVKAKNACILHKNEVERYSPEADAYMDMAKTMLVTLYNQEDAEWYEKESGNEGELISETAENEHAKRLFKLKVNRSKVEVAKIANINWNSHVAAELLSIVERSLCSDAPLPTFRQLGSPPEDLYWPKTLLLTRFIYAEILEKHHNALQENFMKDGRMDWQKAREVLKNNFLTVDDIVTRKHREYEDTDYMRDEYWEWQINAMSFLAIEFCERTGNEDAYGTRLLNLIRSILYPLVTEWKRSDQNPTKLFQEALRLLNSYARRSQRPRENQFRPNLQDILIKFQRLRNNFPKNQIVEIMKVAQAWPEQSIMIVSYVGKPAIDNYCRKRKDERSWHVTYTSSICDKQLDTIFMKTITNHLGPFVYAFWKSLALLVAVKDRDNILTMCELLREVIKKEAADMNNDFRATLVALEECIRRFAGSEDLFDAEVVAKLVRVGMEMLANNLAVDPEKKTRKTVVWCL